MATKKYLNIVQTLAFLTALVCCAYSLGSKPQGIKTAAGQYNECTGCTLEIVESIPEGLTFKGGVKHRSTFEAWKELIGMAEGTIQIGSYYWTLQGHEYDHPTANEGKEIFKLLMSTGMAGKVKISIAQDAGLDVSPNYDTAELENEGAAEVRSLNFTRMLNAGILHTKMMLIDRKHFYVGSANFDWRALTQVKELGVIVTNCSCVGEDIGKAFDVYWKLGEKDAEIPPQWGPEFESEYNKVNPFTGGFNDTSYDSYISSSPPPLCPNGRTTDLDAIFDVIDNAKDSVSIAVMDYFPLTLYSAHPAYWSDIDDRLRKAAIDRRVKIKLLMALWPNTRKNYFHFLKSLEDLNQAYPWVDIQIKMFEVPSTPDQSKIPFARVNHNKYMVTDKSAYIGTSNWSGDYFLDTAGIGFIVTPRGTSVDSDNIQKQLAAIFTRDWESDYAKPLSNYMTESKAASNLFFSPILIITLTVQTVSLWSYL